MMGFFDVGGGRFSRGFFFSDEGFFFFRVFFYGGVFSSTIVVMKFSSEKGSDLSLNHVCKLLT